MKLQYHGRSQIQLQSSYFQGILPLWDNALWEQHHKLWIQEEQNNYWIIIIITIIIIIIIIWINYCFNICRVETEISIEHDTCDKLITEVWLT